MGLQAAVTPAATEQAAVIRRTTSLCPVCFGLLPATLEEHHGDVWMRKQCAQHGESFQLYWKDAAFFREALKRHSARHCCPEPVCATGGECFDHWPRTTNILVNVTERCNYDCPICFSESGQQRDDVTLEKLKEILPVTQPGRKPNLVFIGGEPTLAKDLPQMIRYATDNGYICRLATNGSRLTSPGYLATLHQAGLRWIFLQFDGFDETVHQQLRRRNLNAMKEDVLAACGRAGMRVQFGMMLKGGVNLSQVGPVIRYALKSEQVFWLSTYPHSTVNKNQSGEHQTHVVDVMAALEEQLPGEISRQDFLETMDLFNRLNRVIRSEYLAQKTSIYPMVLFAEKGRVVPINRLWGLGRSFEHHRTVLNLLRHLKAFMNLETTQPPPGTLFFTIQKFHNDDTIGLQEASASHQTYLTARGLVPFDIHNTYYRRMARV